VDHTGAQRWPSHVRNHPRLPKLLPCSRSFSRSFKKLKLAPDKCFSCSWQGLKSFINYFTKDSFKVYCDLYMLVDFLQNVEEPFGLPKMIEMSQCCVNPLGLVQMPKPRSG
jgi:hypothetical protein